MLSCLLGEEVNCPYCGGTGQVRHDRNQITITSPETKEIVAEVCAKHGFTLEEIQGERRNNPIAYARHELMYRLRNELSLTLSGIGILLHRDHTSVIHAIKAHEERMRLRERLDLPKSEVR